jgi:hypothetical protein
MSKRKDSVTSPRLCTGRVFYLVEEVLVRALEAMAVAIQDVGVTKTEEMDEARSAHELSRGKLTAYCCLQRDDRRRKALCAPKSHPIAVSRSAKATRNMYIHGVSRKIAVADRRLTALFSAITGESTLSPESEIVTTPACLWLRT